ncbi:hypothetical protein [Caproiciproducens sp.]
MRDKAKCYDCGMPYGGTNWVDLTLPNDQWDLVFPEHEGLLCANCIVKRAAKLGAISIEAKLKLPEDYLEAPNAK